MTSHSRHKLMIIRKKKEPSSEVCCPSLSDPRVSFQAGYFPSRILDPSSHFLVKSFPGELVAMNRRASVGLHCKLLGSPPSIGAPVYNLVEVVSCQTRLASWQSFPPTAPFSSVGPRLFAVPFRWAARERASPESRGEGRGSTKVFRNALTALRLKASTLLGDVALDIRFFDPRHV